MSLSVGAISKVGLKVGLKFQVIVLSLYSAECCDCTYELIAELQNDRCSAKDMMMSVENILLLTRVFFCRIPHKLYHRLASSRAGSRGHDTKAMICWFNEMELKMSIEGEMEMKAARKSKS
jgi:hypothetical protein